MQNIRLNRPDDWHVHFRDEENLPQTVNATAKQFARALVMPNLSPPLTSLIALQAYRERILSASNFSNFTPYMTFYLNASLPLEDIQKTQNTAYILGAKLYPKGATTHSAQGAKTIKEILPHLKALEENNLVLQVHGETTSGDIFDREANFIETVLIPIVKQFPKLRIVLEHISTRHAVEYIQAAPSNVAATITPHHLLHNRNHLLSGGLKPHYYCLPILKRSCDQKALLEAATSGNPKFFAGTDSAPHKVTDKESSCGCAGIYSAPYALPLYAETFEQVEKLSSLNGFISEYGARFYQLSVNSEEIELVKNPLRIPKSLPLGYSEVIPMMAGETIGWSLADAD